MINGKTRILQSVMEDHLPLVLCVLYFLLMAPFADGFASAPNLVNVFSAMLPLLVLAIGQTLVMITGGIDLSATSVIALASVLGAMVMSGDSGMMAGSLWAVPVALFVMLAIGGSVGAINGSLVAYVRMPPFIVTLTTMMLFSGLAIWVTQSKSISGLPASFIIFGGNVWVTALITASIAVAGQLILTRTLYGRWVFAFGHNAKAATVSGVPVSRVLVLAYITAGLLAAIGAILITGRMESGSPVHWQRNLLDVVGATVIGGTSLYGGKGKVLWTVYGVLFLTLIDNSLNLLNLSHFTIMMVKGAVILFAALMDVLRNQGRR
jgi:ribose/xylose/arabinose/galactoside ABC-type transport system permease subunit